MDDSLNNSNNTQTKNLNDDFFLLKFYGSNEICHGDFLNEIKDQMITLIKVYLFSL